MFLARLSPTIKINLRCQAFLRLLSSFLSRTDDNGTLTLTAGMLVGYFAPHALASSHPPLAPHCSSLRVLSDTISSTSFRVHGDARISYPVPCRFDATSAPPGTPQGLTARSHRHRLHHFLSTKTPHAVHLQLYSPTYGIWPEKLYNTSCHRMSSETCAPYCGIFR